MGTKIVKKSTVKPKKETTIARPKKEAKKVIIKAKKAAEPEPESEESDEELTHIPGDLSESESSGSESEADEDSAESTKGKKSTQEYDDESDAEELGGFSSTDESEGEQEDEEASSDEEEEPKKSKKQAKESHEVKKLPKVDNSASKKSKKTKKGVIYIGRLPDGFEERELSKYFNQFGEITNVKLARNKKTGRSKHFAFLEFTNGDDAKVAQDTMNNYLLMNHQLKVELVNEEFKSSKKAKKSYFRVNKLKKNVKTLNENDNLKKQKRKDALKAAGIDF